jgi:hypothetical protein
VRSMGMKPRLGHRERPLRWKVGSRIESFRSLRRTAVYVLRMYGGVGGEEPRGSPLSRLAAKEDGRLHPWKLYGRLIASTEMAKEAESTSGKPS